MLHGLAFKTQWDIPKYNTTLSESQGSLPVYVSTVIAGGKSFTGDRGRNKREAEPFAARIALQSLLGKHALVFLFRYAIKGLV